jgi:methionyl-tRNA formyltransferase
MKSLRVAFITQDDPFYVRIFFEEFVRRYDALEEVCAVVIAPPMGKKTFGALLRQMYEFYGLIDFVRVGIKYVINRVMSKLPRWARFGRSFSLEHLCERHGIPVLHVQNINTEEFLGALRRLNVHLVVSVAAPQVFRDGLLQLPREGCINIHNSSLPKYRGMLPNFWQMYHGEKSVGTSIHRINAGIDDGEILLQKLSPIEPGESLDSLIRRTKRLGAQFMVEALHLIRTGSVTGLPNSKADSTYFSFPKREDVREFRRRGYRLL